MKFNIVTDVCYISYTWNARCVYTYVVSEFILGIKKADVLYEDLSLSLSPSIYTHNTETKYVLYEDISPNLYKEHKKNRCVRNGVEGLLAARS